MDFLRFTLVGEGSSDANLLPILKWAVREQGVEVAQGVFAPVDLLPKRDLPPKKITPLAEKIMAGLDLYECDLLFIHRDADRTDPLSKRAEIELAVNEVKKLQAIRVPSVPVIPIRETEAWLLIEEKAIRMAANNPNGKNDLKLPTLKRIEKCADPKKELQRVLRTATEWSPQRLKRFDTEAAMARVVDHISDFALLRKLCAFQDLESDLKALRARGWK
jgi:hypothetical protein